MSWLDDAACRGMSLEIFFPEGRWGSDAAKAVCMRCPVTDQCLSFALKNEEQPYVYGVYGGFAASERKGFISESA